MYSTKNFRPSKIAPAILLFQTIQKYQKYHFLSNLIFLYDKIFLKRIYLLKEHLLADSNWYLILSNFVCLVIFLIDWYSCAMQLDKCKDFKFCKDDKKEKSFILQFSIKIDSKFWYCDSIEESFKITPHMRIVFISSIG